MPKMLKREIFAAPVGWVQAIRDEMERRGWNDAELARRLGVNQGQISHLFHGNGQRYLATQVGELFGIPVYVAVESAEEAKAIKLVKWMASNRPRALKLLMETMQEAADSADPRHRR